MRSDHIMFHPGTEEDCKGAKPKMRDGKKKRPAKLDAEEEMPPIDEKENRPKEKILSPKKSGME